MFGKKYVNDLISRSVLRGFISAGLPIYRHPSPGRRC
jgi:hypothetical protein